MFAVPLIVATRELVDSPWPDPVWAIWGVVVGVGGVLLAIDVDVQLLPREVSLPTFLVTSIGLTILESPSDVGRWGPLLGASVMTAITWVLRLVSRGSLGMGDVLVSPLLGAVIGWFDPWSTFNAWLVAAVLGGAGAILSLIRSEPRQSLVAYGPFLFLGTSAAILGTTFR